MRKSGDKHGAAVQEDILKGLFEAEHHPSHDAKWSDFRADPATTDLTGDVLIKAQRLREDEADPGEAYLQGVADYHAYLNRQRLAETIMQDLDSLPTTSEDPR